MRDEGSCRGYLGSRERSRVSRSKKTVWVTKPVTGKWSVPEAGREHLSECSGDSGGTVTEVWEPEQPGGD